MPFFEFRCPKCGRKFEAPTERIWQGQFSFHKSGCGGNCAHCAGCKTHER